MSAQPEEVTVAAITDDYEPAGGRRPVFVLDTNVLLIRPRALEEFPGAEIVIPQVVLNELDKVKSARSDMDLRYRGREVSRRLFELSEKGKLSEGVEFGDNAVVRVVTYQEDGELPPAMRNRTADDQIIAVAANLLNEGRTVTLVTNDLNMLLKAQAAEVPIKRMDGAKSSPIRIALTSHKFQRQLFPALIVVFLMFLSVFMYQLLRWEQTPPEVRERQATITQYQDELQRNPSNLQAMVDFADYYFKEGSYQNAIELYQQALQLSPRDASIRVNLAISYTRIARPDIGITLLSEVVKDYPDNALAHYNRGAILLEMARFSEARAEFQTYMKLQPEGQYVQEAHRHILRINQLLDEQAEG